MKTREPIRCPECGGKVTAELGWEGSAYLQYQVVDGFYCTGPDCYASWDENGDPV